MSNELHVAAMPFPTGQGTQAAVRAMVEARAAVTDAELLVYGDGDERLEVTDVDLPFRLRRAGGPSNPGAFRSGPSFRKLVQDTHLVRATRELRDSTRIAVAHHVEAATACWLVPRCTWATWIGASRR